MTPMRVYKTTSPSPDNYGIEDLKSDDDTDDEDQPRKRIPAWAQGKTMIPFTGDQSSVCYTAYFIKLNYIDRIILGIATQFLFVTFYFIYSISRSEFKGVTNKSVLSSTKS